MPFTLTMPKLSPTMEEGTIVKWHKREGDEVKEGELLIEVATDKATVEHNALDAGFLRKILVKEGESAQTNEPIALFTETANENIDDYEVKKVSKRTEEAKSEPQVEESEVQVRPVVSASMNKPKFVPQPPLEDYSFNYPRKSSGGRIAASPLAKKMAEDKGLNLATVKGTGPNGRIMSRDLSLAQPDVVIGRLESPKIPPGSYREEQMTQMRKVIAQKLQESKSFIPHFYTRIEIDAERLVSVREQCKEGGLKLTYNDFIVKACAQVLRDHPEVNSGYNSANDTIIRFQTIDISLAVTLEQGLITPIIRHADFKAIMEISAEAKDLAARAKAGKLELHEFQGGSFTVSNMGMFDVTDFQAIINPPQAGILAVGSIQDRPVVKEGRVVPGKTLSLVLSADHRVIDGVAAAKFLQDIKKILETPTLLLV